MSDERNGSDRGRLVQLGALWKNEKDGNQYLKGTFGSAQVFVFKNKWKKGEKDPDYKIFVGPRAPRKDGEYGQAKKEEDSSEDGF